MTVVNGGLNQLPRQEFPAPLAAFLALAIDISGIDGVLPLSIDVRAVCETDTSLAVSPYHWEAEITPRQDPRNGMDSVVLNLAVDAQALEIPAAGIYRFELEANGTPLSTVRMHAHYAEVE